MVAHIFNSSTLEAETRSTRASSRIAGTIKQRNPVSINVRRKKKDEKTHTHTQTDLQNVIVYSASTAKEFILPYVTLWHYVSEDTWESIVLILILRILNV